MRFVLVLGVFAIVSCGGGQAVVTPPHVTERPIAPPAVRARWVFSTPEQEIRAKLDLGDHRMLYVGEHGRRELEVGGELQHAATLAEEALGGVMRDDKQRFVFVATDGDTYRATEPLGALERIAPARSEPLASVSTGRAAIVGIGPHGLVRSADWGLTWRPVEYATTKSFGRAAAVALDSKGNGVLVHLPQRLFVTHDDGATWAPLGSPPHGAVTTLRDGADRIFTFGYHDQAATLAADALAETEDEPASIFPGHKLREPHVWLDPDTYVRPMSARRHPQFDLSDLPQATTETLRVLVGDHVVEASVVDKKITIRSALLGEPLGAPSTHDELDQGILDPSRVAARNGELAFLQTPADDDDAKESAAPSSTIWRTKDFGATWKKEETLAGVPATTAHAIAIGPRGWTYVASLCPSRRSSECKPAKIRPAGKAAFEDVTADAAFDPSAFVFDEARGKVYTLSSITAGTALHEGALDSAKLARTATTLTAPAASIAATVDEEGTLRLFERDHGGQLTIRTRSAKGDELAPRYVDIAAGKLAFAGKRGLSIGNHESYETNDAGDTWTRVPSNGAAAGIACGAAGCLLQGAQRVGWDLPALQSTEIVRATTTRPSDQAAPITPPTTKTDPVKITCTVSGKGAAMDDTTDVSWVDGTTPIRWAHVASDYDQKSMTLTYADKVATHRVPLIGSHAPTNKELRISTQEHDGGIVAMRYQFASRSATGKLNPVQVELAWWSPQKPQARHATITVAPFRVQRFGQSGHARVVDGGVVFQSGRNEVIHFVHDDGKEESLAAPHLPIDEIWRSGNHWAVVDADADVLETATSEDGGKTWALHGWAFGQMTFGNGVVETIGGTANVRVNANLYALKWPAASDPPLPTIIDTKRLDARCEGETVGSSTMRDPIMDTPIVLDLAGATFTPSARYFHDTLSGKLCTSVYELDQGRDKEAYLYPDKGGGWSGWSYRSVDATTKVEPLTCK